MKPSNDLFRLIKSLSRNEKGYFKKFAQLHGNPKNTDYLLLFDEIDKQTDEYEEDKIIKKFKNKPLVKHLSATKNYLFDLILKSLRAYYEQSISAFKNESINQNIQLLVEKGLLDIAEKQAEKHEETLIEQDDKASLVRLYKIINGYISNFKTGQIDLLANLDKTINLLDLYKQQLQYATFYQKIFGFLTTQIQARTEEQKQEWQTFMQHPLLQQLPKDAAFNTQLDFYLTHFAYHAIMLQPDEQGNYIRLIMQLWETQHQLKKQQTISFLSCLNNYFVYCLGHELLPEFERYLQAQHLTDLTPALNTLWFTHTSQWQLAIHIYRHTLPQCVQLADTIQEQVLNTYAGMIKASSVITLLGNCALIHICAAQFTKALDLIQYILELKYKNIRKDLLVYFRVWYLIVHLELQNDLLLEHAVRAVKRYAINQEYYFEFENLYMRFFNKYIGSPQADRPELFDQLLQDIEQLESSNSIERNFIQQSGAMLKIWVQHKISSQPLFELVQQQI